MQPMERETDAPKKGKVVYDPQPPTVALYEESNCSFTVFMLLLAFQGLVAVLMLRHFGFITLF
jgi:hypothetical protein